jgi:3-hydroxymyristoyl/3-hydroxydecanoyl-(acyl carrier protein) dehydratase
MFLQHEKKVQEENNQILGTYNKLQHTHLNFIDSNNKISTFNSTYWFIDGHFPQFPCIPGCFLLQGYIQSLGKKGFVKEIISVKFKNMVTPNHNYIFKTLEIKGDIYVFEIYDSITMKICVSGSVII